MTQVVERWEQKSRESSTKKSTSVSSRDESKESDRLRSSVSDEETRINAEIRATATATAAGGGGGKADLKRAMVQRMKSLTLASDEECEGYLDRAGGDLERAVAEFYSK